jgi:hypothetical protein
MKIKNLFAVVIAIALALPATIAVAQAPANLTSTKTKNWMLLGSHIVDYTLDRDVVSLKESTETFSALKFKVNKGPINLHKCTVHYTNGETQDVSFSTEVNEERVIDLYGNKRSIEKVTFWYDTKNRADKKAVVEVWGKK